MKLEDVFLKVMTDFAFLIHPTDLNLVSIAFNDHNVIKKEKIAKKVFEWIPPFKCSHITGIKSITGKEIEGDLIYSPLVPQQVLNLESEILIDTIIRSGHIARNLGAKVFGIGAYLALVARKNPSIIHKIGIPVTTGTCYTIASVIESINLSLGSIKYPLKDTCFTIIGATGTIGKIVAKILAKEIRKLILVARNESKLSNFALSLQKDNPGLEIVTNIDIEKSIKQANVIVIVTNNPNKIIDLKDLPMKSIVCDVSVPHNIFVEEIEVRNDVIFIDGGIIQPPGDVNFNFNYGLPPGLCYACMAETMILALEDKFESYSMGDISEEKVYEILKLGEKHGFKVLYPKYLSKIYNFSETIR